MPAPYLLGAAYMHGVRFHVDRRALIPRSFIGDMLADGALPIGDPRTRRAACSTSAPARAASRSWPRLPSRARTIDAVDLSAGALALARRNVATHRLGDRIALHRGDLFQPLGQAALRPDHQQSALCRCAAAWRSCRRNTAMSRGWRWPPARTASTWCAASSTEAPRHLTQGRRPVVRDRPRPARRSNAPIPRLPFLWLDTEQSQGEVVLD